MKEINLLPKPRQQEIQYGLVYRSLLRILWISVASFAVVFLVQGAAKFYLEGQMWAVKSRTELIKGQVNKEENAAIKKQVTEINNRIADYSTLADSVPRWSRVLKAFAVLPPPGIKITSLQVDPAKKSITIKGESPTRELVISLYDRIRLDESNFYGIDYPLENVAKPENISFHYTFFVKDELLK